MNAVADGNTPDLKQLFERIGDLEELVKRQKDFIDHAGDTWQRLLKDERNRARSAIQDRVRLEDEVRKLEELDANREIERIGLEGQAAATGLDHPSMISLRQENETLGRSLRILEQETAQRVQTLELARIELQTQLGAQRQDEETVGRLGELEAQLAHVQSELRQRQEEIEQTRVMLAERVEETVRLGSQLEQAMVREAALREKLEAADGWVFQLAGARTANEKQLARVARERDENARQLQVAQAHVARLCAVVDNLNARSSVTEPSSVAEQQSPEPIQVKPVEVRGDAIPSDLNAVLKPIEQRDKDQLLQHLNLGPDAVTTGLARRSEQAQDPISNASPDRMGASAPAARAMPVLGQARSNELERKLRDARQHADWLRRLNLVLLRSPKPWWSKFMPVRVRRRRLLDTLDREGIFDGPAYLERYTDVAEAGLDPLTHYLMHGMDEGRDR